MNRKIYTDGHLDGLNGVGGIFPDSGGTKLFIEDLIGTSHLEIPYKKRDITSNEAELIALFHAFSIANEEDQVFSDSQVAINIAKKGKSNEPRFSLIAVALKYLIDTKKLNLQWIPRENNPVT